MIGHSTVYEPEFSSFKQKKEKEKFASEQGSVDLLSGISLANIKRFRNSPIYNSNKSLPKRSIFLCRPLTANDYAFYGCTSTRGNFMKYGFQTSINSSNNIQDNNSIRSQPMYIKEQDHVV